MGRGGGSHGFQGKQVGISRRYQGIVNFLSLVMLSAVILKISDLG